MMWQFSLGGNPFSIHKIFNPRGIRFCSGHSIPVFSDIYKIHRDNFLSYSPCKP
ncbi:hypothetical protein Hanom_Chr05g00431431 [Helianthus anomalus]